MQIKHKHSNPNQRNYGQNTMKQLAQMLLVMGSTSLLLSACGGGGSSSNGGTNATGATLQATLPATASIFATSSCLSGKISTNATNLYYADATLSIVNSCTTPQPLSGQSVSFTSQDKNKVAVAAGTLTNWWVNGAAYSLTFVNGGGNTQTATFTTSDNSNPVINAGQTIDFKGGFNLDNTTYDTDTANKYLSINGQTPVVQTGKLSVAIDTTKAGCTNGVDCSNINVFVKDARHNILATIKVPTANTGAIYTQVVESLPVSTYTLQESSTIIGDTITYTPSATPTVTANTTTSTTITYTQPVAAKTGQATISLTLPTDISSYNGSLSVNVLDTKNSNAVVAAFSLKNGTSQTTQALPISDATHAYAVQVQGVADPLKSLAYAQSALQTITISTSQTTIVKPTLVKTSSVLNQLTIIESGISTGDSTTVTFQDASNKYAYFSYPGVGNGNKTYAFESGLNIAYTINAGGSNYQTNPITGTVVMNTSQNLNAFFTQKATPTPGGATVAGWPTYLAMGAIGGPNIDPTNVYSGDDGFGGKPIDAVFKYAGVNGNGDPGVIDPPMNAIRMTKDLTLVSSINKVPSRVVIVEYTGEMSGGKNLSDFTNIDTPDENKQGATYIMARHFASLAADAIALADKPVVYNGKNYYGSLIMNPDLLGAMQQNKYAESVNVQLPAGAVDTAVDQALCLLTNVRTYTNNDTNSITDWSGKTPRKDSYGKTYTGTPYSILNQMLNDTFPAWIVSSSGDQYWGVGIDNKIQGTENYSAVGTWLNACIVNPTYDKTKYARPNFSAGFDGWVQANNWLIRTFAKQGTVTFGWQDNMWAVKSGFWVHKDLTTDQINSTYSTPVANWLSVNAPSTIKNVGSSYAPDFFVFDRYEMDDSAAPGQATLYSARSWDNFLTGVGLVSKQFNNIPVMLWQIPGSHLPYVGELNPTYYNNNSESGYVYSTAPVYFFGDSNLKPGISNLFMGVRTGESATANTLVGNYGMTTLNSTSITDGYYCPTGACNNYQQYLKYYNGKTNNYDWSKDNGKLALAAQNNVFAILWGGGNTTNVIKNFSNPDDHGWLANKVINYYKNPQTLTK